MNISLYIYIHIYIYIYTGELLDQAAQHERQAGPPGAARLRLRGEPPAEHDRVLRLREDHITSYDMS